jgi:predicted AlkP superfamily phosphohydrolase/phosphomutase
MVVSDHGFGGVGDTALRLNRWLSEQGFLRWKESSPASAWAGRLRSAAVKMIPERAQAPLFRLGGGRLAGAIESRVRFGGIDWSQTIAFSEELNYNPAIWLNVAGRDEAGIVADREYENVCGELTERLLSWRDPYNGSSVVRRVWHRDEIFRGEFLECAPDLTLELEEPGGYSYMCLPSLGAAGDPVEKLSGEALRGGKLTGMSGSHRRQGVFVLQGEGVRAGRLRGARMIDMAPTLLSLMGFDVADRFDGRVLDCVEGAAGNGRGIAEALKSGAESYYDASEESALEDRLTQLGYL